MVDTSSLSQKTNAGDTGPIAAFTSSQNYTLEKKRAFWELCKHTLQHKEYPKKTIEKQFNRPICAIDIETRGLGGEYLVGEAYCEEEDVRFIAYNENDMFAWMIEHPQYLYLSHNASGYEFCYFYEWIFKFFDNADDVEVDNVSQGNGRIVAFIIKRPSTGEILLEWRDTYCLFNCRLEKVAKSYCPELPKGEPGWNKAHDNFIVDDASWMSYLHRDCQIVCRAYRVYQHQVYDLFGSPLGITAGSTAMKAFKHSIEYVTNEDGSIKYREVKVHRTNRKGDEVEYIVRQKVSKMYFRIGKEQEEFVRHAYYGAIVNPGHFIGEWGETASLDVNGAYGFQMLSHEYPVGRGLYTRVYKGDKILGIYKVLASVPTSVYRDLGFNPVPCRTTTGLVWKSGVFETYLTNAEIGFASKRGCSFEIIEGYIWYRTEPVFKTFIELCQKLELMNDGIYKDTAKYQRNNLYGYFGTRPDHNKLVFMKDEPAPGSDFWNNHKHLINNTVPARTIVDAVVPGVFVKEETYDSDYMLPHWAVFTTAWQRVYMMGFMEECYKRGASNVYVDTDSIKTSPEILESMIKDGIIPIGQYYGQFKHEESFIRFTLVGPKSFYGVTKGTCTPISKCKGIPGDIRNEKLFDDAIHNRREQNTFPSTRSLLNIIKQTSRRNGERVRVGVPRKRTITNLENSNAWEIVDNRIFPKGYNELVQVQNTS